MNVRRFFIRAYPHADHPRYFQWQAASIVLFVSDEDKERAERTALEELSKRQWVPERVIRRDTLIKERVQAKGGDVWTAYQQAEAGQLFWLERLEAPAMSTKEKPLHMAPPRLSEQFMDRVIGVAGGRRLAEGEAAGFKEKNADYFLDDMVLELKDLQEEGLQSSPIRQEKLARLFSKYPADGLVRQLDPFTLSQRDFERYLDIVGVPIQKRIQAASKQIKATTQRLAPQTFKGAVILMNTGYSTIPHDFLEYLAFRYSRKDSKSISEVVVISSWVLTNGFDWEIRFAFSPQESATASIQKLKQSFWKNIDDLMSKWGSGGFVAGENVQKAMAPVSFEKDEEVFTFGVPRLDSSMTR